MLPGFYIWFVTYGPCDSPDVPPQLIVGPLKSFAKAQEELQKLGFGYCIKEVTK